MTLLKPVITEKSMAGASRGAYTFLVGLGTTKTMARELVESLFKVHVTKLTVRRTHIPGKRTGRRRLPGSDSVAKYATVWLKKGESLALFDLKEQK